MRTTAKIMGAAWLLLELGCGPSPAPIEHDDHGHDHSHPDTRPVVLPLRAVPPPEMHSPPKLAPRRWRPTLPAALEKPPATSAVRAPQASPEPAYRLGAGWARPAGKLPTKAASRSGTITVGRVRVLPGRPAGKR